MTKCVKSGCDRGAVPAIVWERGEEVELPRLNNHCAEHQADGKKKEERKK